MSPVRATVRREKIRQRFQCLRGARETAGRQTPRPPREFPPASPDAARGRRRPARRSRPGSSIPPRPRAPARACRRDRPRPAPPAPARGCRRAPRWCRTSRSPDRARRRSSRGTPHRHRRDGARASRAGRSSRSSRRSCWIASTLLASMKKCGAIRISPRTRWSCTLPAYHAAIVAPSLWPNRMPRRKPIASSSCGSTSVASRCM